MKPIFDHDLSHFLKCLILGRVETFDCRSLCFPVFSRWTRAWLARRRRRKHRGFIDDLLHHENRPRDLLKLLTIQGSYSTCDCRGVPQNIAGSVRSIRLRFWFQTGDTWTLREARPWLDGAKVPYIRTKGHRSLERSSPRLARLIRNWPVSTARRRKPRLVSAPSSQKDGNKAHAHYLKHTQYGWLTTEEFNGRNSINTWPQTVRIGRAHPNNIAKSFYEVLYFYFTNLLFFFISFFISFLFYSLILGIPVDIQSLVGESVDNFWVVQSEDSWIQLQRSTNWREVFYL